MKKLVTNEKITWLDKLICTIQALAIIIFIALFSYKQNIDYLWIMTIPVTLNIWYGIRKLFTEL